MSLDARIRVIRQDTAVLAGVVGGVIASLSGILGYVVVPVLTGAQPSLVEASVSAATTPTRFSPSYHAAVMVLPAFALAFAGTLAVRASGVATGLRESTVLAGIVLGPLVTVFVGYLLTAVAVGLTFSSGGTAVTTDPLLAVAYTAFALLFGLLFLSLAVVGVTLATGGGTLAGYLCARGVGRVVGWNGRTR